jgi:3'(2'), 5'-bisphosphate nucleotidase
MDHKEMMFVAVNAALKASEAIMKIYEEGLKSVSYKDDRSPLTKADLESNRIISESLAGTGIQILSEEGRHIPLVERKNWKEYWLVDPLDGTKEFISRNGEFTVNIALMKENRPFGGVIHVTVWKRLYFSLKGFGSFMFSGENIAEYGNLTDLAQASVKLEGQAQKDNFTIVASRSHMNEDTQNFIEMIEQHFGQADLISRGSSLKFCKLAEGKADIYPRFGRTMEWDTAAGHAIAEESGCEITQTDMKSSLTYNKQDLANPDFIVWRKGFIEEFQ